MLVKQGSLVSWLPLQSWEQGNSPPGPQASPWARGWWRSGSCWTSSVCGSDAVTGYMVKLFHTPLLPASKRASAEVHLSSRPGSSAACPASSSHHVGTMGSSSITSHGTDLLTYSRGNVTLLFSSYEITASFSLWVNRGVEVINPSTGNLTRTIESR